MMYLQNNFNLFILNKLAERVGFEPAGKRKLKDLQRTGSDLKQRKFMKNHKTGFRGFQGFQRSFPQADLNEAALRQTLSRARCQQCG
jgi:hypothetical protein